MTCSFDIENTHQGLLVCGLDEAGRGPLAGPVTAACVHVPDDVRGMAFWAEVTDSKKLTAKKRDRLFDLIREHCAFGIAECSAEEIDQMNILRASLLAMARSLELMQRDFNVVPAMALVDGNQKPPLSCGIQTIVKGDSLSLSIAAASILAKVTRDRVMEDLCRQFPMYGWSSNAGYGTATHMAALQEHGATPHHRKTFAPIRDLIQAA
jgi:ribonuclease HII